MSIQLPDQAVASRLRRNYIAFQTIIYRETRRYLRIWTQTLIPPAITMTLYFLIFGRLIGSQIRDMDGLRYMDYIVPGLIMMSVITNAYSNVVSSFFGAKFQRHIEEILVAPVPSSVILLGYMVGGIGRALLVGVLVTAVAAFFTDLHVAHPAITLSIVILTAALFSLGGILNALFAKNFDDISIIPTFVLTPLTYLGGVFYSIKMLPEPWHTLSLANPILYMVNAFRYGFLGVSDVAMIHAYLIIVASVVVLFVISLVLLRRGVGLRS